MKKVSSILKRIAASLLSVIIAALCFSVVPIMALDSFDATVYVSNSGSDTASGTEDAPVATISGAYAALKKAMGSKATDASAKGRIVLLNNISTKIADKVSNAAEKYVYTVTVTGKTPQTQFICTGSKQGYYNHNGPTVYKDITLCNKNTANYVSFHTNGTSITMDTGVTTVKNSNDYSITIAGAPQGSYPSTNTDIVVKSGDWQVIYADGYSYCIKNATSKVTMTGGSAKTLSAGYARIGGPVIFDLKDCTFGSMILGANTHNYTDYWSGSVTANLENVTVNGNLYCTEKSGATPGDVTVNIKGNTTVSGYINPKSTGKKTVNISAESGEKFALLGEGECEVDSFTGGGTVELGIGTTLNIKSVSGSSDFVLENTPATAEHSIIAPVSTPDSAFGYKGTSGELKITSDTTNKYWSIEGGTPQMTEGLILKAPTDVTVKLYKSIAEIDEANFITPNEVETVDNINYYKYSALKAGNYKYTVKGTGYYSTQKNLYFSEAKASTVTTVEVKPEKKAGTGYEPTLVKLQSDEFEEAKFTIKDSWRTDYPDVFTTPALKPDCTQAPHQFTSQEEMEEYIASVKATGSNRDNMYIYTLCKTPDYKMNMPLVIFTKEDLSGAATWQDAVAILRKNGLLNILYHAQMHGSEPAGGEAALARIHAFGGDEGKDVIKTANVVIIPRLNPEGSKDGKRNSTYNGFDMNSDFLTLRSTEVENLVSLYNKLEPEVAIDGHEYTTSNTISSGLWHDILLGNGTTMNSSNELRQLGIDANKEVISKLNSENLVGIFYPLSGTTSRTENIFNNVNPNGRSYIALKGCLSWLIEARGIDAGKEGYEHRVTSQYIGVSAMFDYVLGNAAEVIKVTHAERENIINSGKTFDESDRFTLHSLSDYTEAFPVQVRNYNYLTGEITSERSKDCYFWNISDRSRAKPTAYILPKDMPNIDAVLNTIEKHSIKYYAIDGRVSINLKQYTLISSDASGAPTEAGLTPEQSVTFENGCYVFTANQVSALIMMYLFEPDNTDILSRKATFAQSGAITARDGLFPIYRYEHDLEADGTVYTGDTELAPQNIVVTPPTAAGEKGTVSGLKADRLYKYRKAGEAEYTPVPAGSTSFKVYPGKYTLAYADNDHAATLPIVVESAFEGVIYLDANNGDDTNSGFGEDEAVKSLVAAYSKANNACAKYGKTDVRIVFLTNFAVDAAETPSETQLKITDTKNAMVDFPQSDYNVTLCGKTGKEVLSSIYTISFKGNTTIENITLKNTSGNQFRYLCGSGYKFVLGENITGSDGADSKERFMLVGGNYRASGTQSEINMTVLSGYWQNIYFGPYVTGSYSGPINVEILGGKVFGSAQLSYSITVSGNVNITVKNTEFVGDFYLGNVGSLSTANITADMTVYLGEGTVLSNFYAGSGTAVPSGDLTGKIRVLLDGATASGVISDKGPNANLKTVDCKIITLGDWEADDETHYKLYDGKKFNIGEHVYDDDCDDTCNVCGHKRHLVTLGDVNNDGKVDVSDCVCIRMYVAKEMQLTDLQLAAADVDGIPGVTKADAQFLAEYIVGIRNSLN